MRSNSSYDHRFKPLECRGNFNATSNNM